MDLRQIQSGASATPPTAPASPSSGFTTAGVPGVSPASVPGPYWYHQISEEMRNILTAAGVTPDYTVLTQLKAALDALYAPAANANTRTGHTYAQNDWYWVDKAAGVIEQEVYVASIPANSTVIVTLPTTFTTAIYSIVGSWDGNATTGFTGPFNALPISMSQISISNPNDLAHNAYAIVRGK